jgi:hypothetical protein
VVVANLFFQEFVLGRNEEKLGNTPARRADTPTQDQVRYLMNTLLD